MGYAAVFVLLLCVGCALAFVASGLTTYLVVRRIIRNSPAFGVLAGVMVLVCYPFLLFKLWPPGTWFDGKEGMFGFELVFFCWLMALISPVVTLIMNRWLIDRWQKMDR